MSHLLAPFRKILARYPAPTFADGLTTVDLGKPDYDRALVQYERYLQTLRDCGLEVTVLEADSRFPDGHFVEDPVIVFRDLVFACRSGALSRRKEGTNLLAHFPAHRQIHIQDDNAFIDGGDVLFCADRVLIGLSERTNQAGAAALKAALQTVQADIRVDFVPFTGLLHLKSGLTELSAGVLVHDPALKTDFDFSWTQIVTLPAAEGYAADVMPINDTLVMAAGFPYLRQVAEQHYQQIVELDMSEFQKMDGGLTCLSLRY